MKLFYSLVLSISVLSINSHAETLEQAKAKAEVRWHAKQERKAITERIKNKNKTELDAVKAEMRARMKAIREQQKLDLEKQTATLR